MEVPIREAQARSRNTRTSSTYKPKLRKMYQPFDASYFVKSKKSANFLGQLFFCFD